MMSTGFHWGSPKGTGINEFDSMVKYVPVKKTSMNNKKRRMDELDDEFENDENRQEGMHTGSRKVINPHKYKKSKTPNIIGQLLPVNRLVEVLDHHSLQRLLQDLIQVHPEISGTINKLSPKPTVSHSITLLKEKFECIIAHLPYKCDVESDYSYLRIKPYLNEFLNCLSDFILHFLPPVEMDVIVTLSFLDLITDLVRELPNFSNSEFQYTKSMAYEQIANTWLIAMNAHSHDEESSNAEVTPEAENSIKLIKIIEDMNLEEKVMKYNDSSLGKFKLVLDFIRSQREIKDKLDHMLNNNGSSLLSDLITVDYSNFSITAKSSH